MPQYCTSHPPSKCNATYLIAPDFVFSDVRRHVIYSILRQFLEFMELISGIEDGVNIDGCRLSWTYIIDFILFVVRASRCPTSYKPVFMLTSAL